ncbi:MAG: hypothetical protein BMS9Abin18_0250 [Zetaproteobacteria bacterium]|nr:MAG: hypothetical protein BMS9Abin18_0250 [Zetaproteobacteria bacterium]
MITIRQKQPSQQEPGNSPRQFHVVLIKPSHYDDDGYVIQWLRSAVPSNTLAVLYGLSKDMTSRKVLGEDVEIVTSAFDETNTRIPVKKIIKQIKSAGAGGFVGFVGVQSNQFPRAMDMAAHFRKAGIQVCIGGFHISGCLAMLPKLPNDIRMAQDMGVSLFAGEAEGRLEEVFIDAYAGQMKPLYNYLSQLPAIESAPPPFLPARILRRSIGSYTTFDAGRGCPFLCSFCTIINVQGRKSRRRSADDVEHIIRENAAQGISRFFITDDNFARNRDWEAVFDRLIMLREQEGIKMNLTIQVDTMCHRIPRFIEKAGQANVVSVFIGLESINPDSLKATGKKQNKITEYRRMLQAWRDIGAMTCAGYILGFPTDTPESIVRDIRIIKHELPVDLLEFFMLTPLPGSQDHKELDEKGIWMDPDMNKYDVNHVTTGHPLMSKADWERAWRLAWETYYSPDHIETIIKRARPDDIGVSKVTFMSWWFYYCTKYEKVHPFESGLFRHKYRLDRRSGLAIENPLIFYPRRWWEFMRNHAVLLSMLLKYGRILKRIKADANARSYTDFALTPVTDAENDSGSLELLAQRQKTTAISA